MVGLGSKMFRQTYRHDMHQFQVLIKATRVFFQGLESEQMRLSFREAKKHVFMPFQNPSQNPPSCILFFWFLPLVSGLAEHCLR